MARWLHYLLTLTLLLNAVALPWSQAQCPHRAALLAMVVDAQVPPCHQTAKNALEEEETASDVCACGCIVQAAMSLVIVIPVNQAPHVPAATAINSVPMEPSIALLLRPPIARI